MRKLLTSSFLSCLVISLGFGFTTVIAPERTVGVNVDEWFRYSHVFNWESSDPNATIPPMLELIKEMEWTFITILDVSGTNVTFQRVMHLKNGTELPPEGAITDVDTGDGNATVWVVSANLNPNDTLYTAGDYSIWRINETISRTYPDVTRDTNHVNLTAEMNMSGVYMHTSQNFYWDKSTGILVETAVVQQSHMESIWTNMTSIITITESDVWVIPELPIWTPTLLTLTTLTAAIVVYKRKQLKST